MTDIKRCASKNCQETDPKAFGDNKGTKDGLRCYCRKCSKSLDKKYRESNPDKSRAKCKRYRDANPDKVRTSNKAYYAGNREYEKERSATYREANPDYGKAYREANPEKEHARCKRYREANPEKMCAKSNRYRASKRALPFQFTDQDWQECLEFYGHSCAYCGNPYVSLEQDHFIPLDDSKLPDDLKGLSIGTVPWNMVPACGFCNGSKHNKDPFQWLPAESSFWVHALRRITSLNI
jgi:hypothetical protein